jgi:hypothetical protein
VDRSGRDEQRRPRPRPGPERHGPGDPPEAVGGIIRAILGGGRLRRGSALGRLVLSWEEVVGPELAVHTEPRALEEGGLLVAASSAAWGSQVRFLASEIRRRANAALGGAEVTTVRVMVSSGAGDALRGKGFQASEGGDSSEEEGPSR